MAKGREVSLAKLFVCPGFFCSNKSEHAELVTINSYEPLHYKKSENSLAIFIMKDATSEAGHAYSSGAPELTPSF